MNICTEYKIPILNFGVFIYGVWGSFASFAYFVIPNLSCHLRPMVRKGKSLLFGHGHISRLKKKRRRHRRKPPFLAELDISESFETN